MVDAGAPAAERDAARAWATRSWASLRPWGSGRVYPNFPDPDLADAPRAYWAGNLERLARAAARYDPEAVFGFPAIAR